MMFKVLFCGKLHALHLGSATTKNQRQMNSEVRGKAWQQLFPQCAKRKLWNKVADRAPLTNDKTKSVLAARKAAFRREFTG